MSRHELIPQSEIENRAARGAVGITAITRLKHADLLAAARRLADEPEPGVKKRPGIGNGQSALARRLRVHEAELGKWINFQSCPPTTPSPRGKWTAKRIMKLEADLFELTGKTMEELFPQELRDNIQFLAAPKVFERTAHIENTALTHYAIATRERMLLSQQPAKEFTEEEIAEKIKDALDTLPPQQREILERRFGLNGHDPQTLDAVAAVFGVRREWIRQLEARAIRNLQTAPTKQRETLKDIIDADFT